MKFSQHVESLDSEINIVPIIDCLVMLICFLLFTATFTQLVYIEAKIASNTASAAEKSRSEFDQFRLILDVDDGGIQLKTSGNRVKQNFNERITKQGNLHDFKTLHEKIIQIKTAHPERFSADIEIKGSKNIVYEDIAHLIDSLHHLSDSELSSLKISQKRLKQIPLTTMEKEIQSNPAIENLAASIASNEISKNTDNKLLFPDVAILGIN